MRCLQPDYCAKHVSEDLLRECSDCANEPFKRTKLRIITDGTPENTHLVTAEGGVSIDFVKGLSWSISLEGTEAVITVSDVELVAIPKPE